MLLRRGSTVAIALLALAACAPSVPKENPPAKIDYAVFDPTTGTIPLPNDLALQTTLPPGTPAAQIDFIQNFKDRGGFPNDQEVAITIPFTSASIDASTGAVTQGSPDLDLTSINDQTLVIVKAPGTVVPHDPVTAADYKNGVLTVHNVGRKPWDAGAQYFVGVRGGAAGVKTKGGGTISPQPTFFLLTRGVKLDDPNNQSLIPGNDRVEKAALGKTLEQLRENYLTPFAILDPIMPSRDLAVMSTFKIAAGGYTQIQTDPNRGLIPIPSDFLRGPDGKVLNISAFGPLAAGLATLDGFSTTAPITASTNNPIVASTVNKDTVLVYEIVPPASAGALPTAKRVPDATEAGGNYISEPPQVTQDVSGVKVSTAVVLQPAFPVPGPNGSVIVIPPLKEDTTYAVLVTNGVKDFPNQQPLQRGTLASILLAPPDHPVAVNGKSQISSLDDATATGLEAMRQGLNLVIGTATAQGKTTRANVVMGYTFKTQSITGKGNVTNAAKPAGALQLAALPYLVDKTALTAGQQGLFKPGAPAALDVATAFAKYGSDTGAIPNGDIESFVEVKVPTVNLLSKDTGAFDSTLIGTIAAGGTAAQGAIAGALEQLNVLVALPKAAAVPACPGTSGLRCAPMVVFHHGLGGGRDDMLTVANELAKAGMIVVATDAPKHGDRSWCTADTDCLGGTCDTSKLNGAAMGDAVKPGICTSGVVAKKGPRHCAGAACLGAWANFGGTGVPSPAGAPKIWAEGRESYLVSGNFFRTRDSFRQDVVDHSAMTLALAPPFSLAAGLPSCSTTAPTVAPFFCLLASKGLVVDAAHVNWMGQSLGSILGTLNLASNPRFTSAALNVGGGTLTDILANAPSFKASTCALLKGAGIAGSYDAATNSCPILSASGYLQFLLVAKWVLDPADPINYAPFVTGANGAGTLPNLISGTAQNPFQPAKAVIGQMALCDATVPNPFNSLLYGLMGLSQAGQTFTMYGDKNKPLAGDTTLSGAPNTCPLVPSGAPASVSHGFVTSWGIGDSDASVVHDLTLTAQDNAAAFLMSGTKPPPAVLLP